MLFKTNVDGHEGLHLTVAEALEIISCLASQLKHCETEVYSNLLNDDEPKN